MDVHGPTTPSLLEAFLPRQEPPGTGRASPRLFAPDDPGPQDGLRLRGPFAFHALGPGLFENGTGTARLRFGEDGRFHVQVRGAEGSTTHLSGLRIGDEMFFRSEGGELFSASVFQHPGSEQFGLFALQGVTHAVPSGDESDLLAVDFDPATGAFDSDDGSLRGRYDPETGRIAGVFVDAAGERHRFQGLVGNGFAVASFDGGEAVTFGIESITAGGFTLRGLQGLMNPGSGAPDADSGPVARGSGAGGAFPLLGDPGEEAPRSTLDALA